MIKQNLILLGKMMIRHGRKVKRRSVIKRTLMRHQSILHTMIKLQRLLQKKDQLKSGRKELESSLLSGGLCYWR